MQWEGLWGKAVQRSRKGSEKVEERQRKAKERQ